MLLLLKGGGEGVLAALFLVEDAADAVADADFAGLAHRRQLVFVCLRQRRLMMRRDQTTAKAKE